MITCYDWSFARLINQTAVDAILVGDSAAMVMHGHQNTATMPLDAMCYHVESVRRGAPDKFIVADVPFGWAHKDATSFMGAVADLVSAGAEAIKIEGVGMQNENIARAIDAGIPVMGHIGLTPQHVNKLGGYKIQGKSEKSAALLAEQARALEDLGCFAAVLECVTSEAAHGVAEATDRLVTIGIGAGVETDGQVLVLQDLLGMSPEPHPRFVRTFSSVGAAVQAGISDFVEAVQAKSFPGEAEQYRS